MNAEKIFAPLNNIAAKLSTTSSDVGFPVKLPGSATYSFGKFGDNFLLLTDTYLYTYGTNGGQIYALRHGYSAAEQKANDKRVLLYDKGSTKFSLYNRTGLVYEKEADEKIVYAALSDTDYAAIVTTSSRYSNIIQVYDGSGNWKYTHMFVDENVMQAEFTDDGAALIVTTVSVADGDISSSVYRFDLNSEENGVWKYTVPTNSLTFAIHTTSTSAVILCDNICMTLDIKTGALLGSYTVQGTLKCYDASDDMTVLLLNDLSTGSVKLVTLNANSEKTAQADASLSTSNLAIDGKIVYTLEGMKIGVYAKTLEKTSEKALTQEYSSFIKIGNAAYLLGYDEVAQAWL